MIFILNLELLVVVYYSVEIVLQSFILNLGLMSVEVVIFENRSVVLENIRILNFRN